MYTALAGTGEGAGQGIRPLGLPQRRPETPKVRRPQGLAETEAVLASEHPSGFRRGQAEEGGLVAGAGTSSSGGTVGS